MCDSPANPLPEKMALFGTFSSGSSSGFLGIVVAAAMRKARTHTLPREKRPFCHIPLSRRDFRLGALNNRTSKNRRNTLRDNPFRFGA